MRPRIGFTPVKYHAPRRRLRPNDSANFESSLVWDAADRGLSLHQLPFLDNNFFQRDHISFHHPTCDVNFVKSGAMGAICYQYLLRDTKSWRVREKPPCIRTTHPERGRRSQKFRKETFGSFVTSHARSTRPKPRRPEACKLPLRSYAKKLSILLFLEASCSLF